MGSGRVGNGFAYTVGYRQSCSIDQGQQDKHIVGANNYNTELKQDRQPSILTGDAQQLLKEGVGKGKLYEDGKKEVVDYNRVIGKCWDKNKKVFYETTRATIHYGINKNAHIVPTTPRELIKGDE